MAGAIGVVILLAAVLVAVWLSWKILSWPFKAARRYGRRRARELGRDLGLQAARRNP